MKTTPAHTDDIDGHLHALVEALWGAQAAWRDVRDVIEELAARAPGDVDVVVLPRELRSDPRRRQIRLVLLMERLLGELPEERAET